MSRRLHIFLNWLAIIVTLAVNSLANILPINGMTTDEVSDLYSDLFTPADFTFLIWIAIYFFLAGYAVMSTWQLATQKQSETPIAQLVQRVNPYFRISCVLNCCWILAWHYLQIGLSVLTMFLLFLTLLKIFNLLQASVQNRIRYVEHQFVETPFIIYFAWITVALIANINVLLMRNGWMIASLSEPYWTCILISLATVAGIWMAIWGKRPAYAWIIAWAMYGIYAKQAHTTLLVANVAAMAVVVSLLASAVGIKQRWGVMKAWDKV